MYVRTYFFCNNRRSINKCSIFRSDRGYNSSYACVKDMCTCITAFKTRLITVQ